LCQCGDIKLSTEFIGCARDPTDVKLSESICPDLIIERVQTEQINVIESNPTDSQSKKSLTTRCSYSQNSRTTIVLSKNKISFDPKMGVFNIQNSEGCHDAVILFQRKHAHVLQPVNAIISFRQK